MPDPAVSREDSHEWRPAHLPGVELADRGASRDSKKGRRVSDPLKCANWVWAE